MLQLADGVKWPSLVANLHTLARSCELLRVRRHVLEDECLDAVGLDDDCIPPPHTSERPRVLQIVPTRANPRRMKNESLAFLRWTQAR